MNKREKAREKRDKAIKAFLEDTIRVGLSLGRRTFHVTSYSNKIRFTGNYYTVIKDIMENMSELREVTPNCYVRID